MSADSLIPQIPQGAYYQKWYRPDNQAIIVVGDVDVNHMEDKIKNSSQVLCRSQCAQGGAWRPCPDNKEAIYVYQKDKEMQMANVWVMMKHEATKPEEKAWHIPVQDYAAVSVISQMINQRLSEMTQDAACPFFQDLPMIQPTCLGLSKDCFELIGIPKEGKEMETLQVLYREAVIAR